MGVIDLTSDSSENENGSEANISVIEVPEFSDNVENDEFPYKCQQCPEKFRQISEAQTHFAGAHQNSEEDFLEIKEEDISEDFCPEIFENLVSQDIISESFAPEDDNLENFVSQKYITENPVSENDIYEIFDSENDISVNEGSENKISKNHVSENSASEGYGSKSDNSENNGTSLR